MTLVSLVSTVFVHLIFLRKQNMMTSIKVRIFRTRDLEFGCGLLGRKLPGELFAEVGERFLFQASDEGLDIMEEQKAFGKGVYLTDQAETRSDLDANCKSWQNIHDIA